MVAWPAPTGVDVPVIPVGPPLPARAKEPDMTVARFLKPEEVAEELSVTASQVYTLMRTGQLPAVKIGRRGVWRVSREALEAYIASLEANARERAGPV